LDENGPSKVTLSLDQPSKTNGEQKFSSFTDVKQYLDMISGPATASKPLNQASPTIAVAQSIQPGESKPADSIVEYKAKSGDSLMKLAWRHKVSPDRLKELNPKITKWRSIPNRTNNCAAVSNPGKSADFAARRTGRVGQPRCQHNRSNCWPRRLSDEVSQTP